ncbi:MAG: MlaD family protein [Gemmatimonadota bacterium]
MRQGTPVTREHVRVGIVLILALGLLTFAVLRIGGSGHVFGERYRLVTTLRTAAGLAPGAVVQLAGQSVGQVDQVELIEPEDRPASGEAVAVWLAINLEVQNQIRSDSRAQVRTQGLLGDKVIDIRPGTAEARVLMPGDTVPSAGSTDYDALIAEGALAVEDLTELTRNLADLTSGFLAGQGTIGQLVTDDALYTRIVSISQSLDELLAGVASDSSSLVQLLTDDVLYHSLRSSVAAFDTLTSIVAAGEGTLGRMLRSDSLYLALRSTVRRSDSLLASMQAGQGTAGKLLTDDRMYEELLKTVGELNSLLKAVQEDPDRYVPPISIF